MNTAKNKMEKENGRGRKKDIKSKGGIVRRQGNKLIEKREGIKMSKVYNAFLGMKKRQIKREAKQKMGPKRDRVL